MTTTTGRLLRCVGWTSIALFFASLAFGVEQSSPSLELPDLVVRGIDRARLDAQRRGTISVETSDVEPGLRRVDIPAGAALERELGEAPTAQTPGCAYRAPVTSAMARMTHDPEAYYKSGLAALEESRLDQAAFYFDQVSRRQPDHPLAGDSLFWVAEIKRRQGKVSEALVTYRKVDGRYAGEADYRYAWLAHSDGRTEQARVAWARVAADADNAHNDEAHYRLGLDRYRNGDVQGAVAPLNKALDRTDPQSDIAASAGFVLGMTQRELGELGEAEKALTAMLLSRPDHPAATAAKVALAWVLLEKGQPEEADRRFAWALEETLRSELATLAWYGRSQTGVLAADPERVQAALDGLDALEVGAPWLAWGYADLGWTHFGRGEFSEALDSYRVALSDWGEGDRGVPEYMAAESLYRLGRYEKAADAFEQVTSESPMVPAAYHRGGVAALLAGDAPRAERLLGRVVTDYPGYEEMDRIWAWIGEARLRQGDSEGARRAFEAVPPESDAFAQTLYARAWVAFEGERWDEAAELFIQHLNRFPNDPNHDEASLTLARAHFNRRAIVAAVRVLDELARTTADPHVVSASRYHKGWMLVRADRTEQGWETLEALLGDEPDGPYAAKAQLALGWSFFGLERYEQALSRFEAVLALKRGGPDEEQARRKRADTLYNLGRYEESLTAYEALGATPEGLYGRVLSLQRLERSGEMEKTVEHFAQTFPEDERTGELMLILARSLDQAGHHVEAAKAYQRAATMTGSASGNEARLAGARNLAAAGQYQAAEKELMALVRMGGATGDAATRELARFQAGAWRYEAAAQTLRQAAAGQTEPEAAIALLRDGAEYARQGGLWKVAARMTNEALEKVGETNPELHAGLITDLGRIQLQSGDSAQAAATLAQAIEAGAGLSAMRLLGNALDESGQRQPALETYLRIGYLYPLEQSEAAQAMLRAGILLEADGRAEQARKVFEKVCDNGPDPWQQEAKLRLKAMQAQ